MDTQEAVLEKIFKRTTLGIRFGLDRIKQAAEELGFNHILAYDHVLGANPDRPGG